MSDRFDDIFSLDRLRENWSSGPEKKQGKKDPEKKNEMQQAAPDPGLPYIVKTDIDARSEFELLKELLNEKYPGEKGEGLQILLQELDQALLLRFPGTENISGQDKTGLNQAINEILNQVEDLMEAIDIGD